jgi:hypothetical protein
MCLLLLYLRVALFWFILFDVPPCTQAIPNLIARTFVVAGLSVVSVWKSPRVYWFVSVRFKWILPGGFQVLYVNVKEHLAADVESQFCEEFFLLFS